MKSIIILKKTTISKSILFFLIFVLFITCDSDDNSIESSQLLSDFQEPNLNFRISPEELIIQEGTPDENNASSLVYLNPQNGVTEFRYVILVDFLTKEPFYGHVNVDIHANQQNLNFIINWLTNKYGSPEFINFSSGAQGYEWSFSMQADGELRKISIVFSGDGLEANETFLLDFNSF